MMKCIIQTMRQMEASHVQYVEKLKSSSTLNFLHECKKSNAPPPTSKGSSLRCSESTSARETIIKISISETYTTKRVLLNRKS